MTGFRFIVWCLWMLLFLKCVLLTTQSSVTRFPQILSASQRENRQHLYLFAPRVNTYTPVPDFLNYIFYGSMFFLAHLNMVCKFETFAGRVSQFTRMKKDVCLHTLKQCYWSGRNRCVVTWIDGIVYTASLTTCDPFLNTCRPHQQPAKDLWTPFLHNNHPLLIIIEGNDAKCIQLSGSFVHSTSSLSDCILITRIFDRQENQQSHLLTSLDKSLCSANHKAIYSLAVEIGFDERSGNAVPSSLCLSNRLLFVFGREELSKRLSVDNKTKFQGRKTGKATFSETVCDFSANSILSAWGMTESWRTQWETLNVNA